jgi:hypothetical protein
LNGSENEDDTNNDDDLPLEEWLRKVNCDELDQYDYDAYRRHCYNGGTDDDIVSEVKKDRAEDDAEERDEVGGEDCSEVPIPTVSDAVQGPMGLNVTSYVSKYGQFNCVFPSGNVHVNT